jgi:hypothetical protein
LSFSLAIVSTYFYVDTILVYRFGPFKMGWLDAYRERAARVSVPGRQDFGAAEI